MLLGQRSEPAFGQNEPGGAGHGAVRIKKWIARELALDYSGLVGGVVVDDPMELEPGRHPLVDGPKELAKRDDPMPVTQLADHGLGLEVERGEEVAAVIAQVVRSCAARFGLDTSAILVDCGQAPESDSSRPCAKPARCQAG